MMKIWIVILEHYNKKWKILWQIIKFLNKKLINIMVVNNQK